MICYIWTESWNESESLLYIRAVSYLSSSTSKSWRWHSSSSPEINILSSFALLTVLDSFGQNQFQCIPWWQNMCFWVNRSSTKQCAEPVRRETTLLIPTPGASAGLPRRPSPGDRTCASTSSPCHTFLLTAENVKAIMMKAKWNKSHSKRETHNLRLIRKLARKWKTCICV